jgi:hypothetical protein
MKKLSGRGYIGFKPNEVNAKLDPHHLDVLDEVEVQRKERRRLNQKILNLKKFLKQQNTWLSKGVKKRTLKFTKHSMQIDKGFEIAKKWRAEQNDNSR